jgi:hypothetical protein
MLKKSKPTSWPPSRRDIEPVDAETVAIRVLNSLAEVPERLGQFLAATGISPEAIREVASSPGFLAAVLDHVSSDEQLLLEIAGENDLAPEAIAAARQALARPDTLPDE